MEVFNLIVDRKVEVWRRDNISIEAESQEEAAKIALEGIYDVDDSEYLYETEQTMSPCQNFTNKAPTIEVMDEYGNVLTTNIDYDIRSI